MEPEVKAIYEEYSVLQAQSGCFPYALDMTKVPAVCDIPQGAMARWKKCDMQDCMSGQTGAIFFEPTVELGCWATRCQGEAKFRVHAACYYWWAFR